MLSDAFSVTLVSPHLTMSLAVTLEVSFLCDATVVTNTSLFIVRCYVFVAVDTRMMYFHILHPYDSNTDQIFILIGGG